MRTVRGSHNATCTINPVVPRDASRTYRGHRHKKGAIMARTSSTPVATREAVTASVPTRSAEAIGEELAPYLRGSADTFNACRIASAGIGAGQTGQAIADATTKALAFIMYPDVKSAAYRDALETSVSRGGAKVTRVAIDQRKNAWNDVVTAGLTPTENLVEKSYKLATTGGSAEIRAKLVTALAKVPAGTREAAFLKKFAEATVALRKANADKKSTDSATASADDKAEVPETDGASVTVMDDTAEEIVAYLHALGARKFTASDAALITDALADLAAKLS